MQLNKSLDNIFQIVHRWSHRRRHIFHKQRIYMIMRVFRWHRNWSRVQLKMNSEKKIEIWNLFGFPNWKSNFSFHLRVSSDVSTFHATVILFEVRKYKVMTIEIARGQFPPFLLYSKEKLLPSNLLMLGYTVPIWTSFFKTWSKCQSRKNTCEVFNSQPY